MSTRSPVDRAKARSIESAIAAAGGQVTLDRGLYGQLAAGGISRGEVRRALDDLEAQGRVTVCGGGRVTVRLVSGDR